MKSKNKGLPGATWYSYLFLYGILKPILFLYFRLFQNVHFHRNGFKVPRGPVFFIGNHHTNWDGFYHCIMFYNRFPHYIVHDEAFRDKRYQFVFGRFLGQVPRARTAGDIEPVKALKRLAQSGQSVNVYPEGDIHMFGGTLPIDESIAKMARFINLPIVLTRVSGAHLRAPRWSRFAHHHHIDYEITDVISLDELKQADTKTLHERIINGIKTSEYDWQEKSMRPVWGAHRAEWLELGLYLCPRCHEWESFVSKGNHLTCVRCGLTVFVNRHLMLEANDKSVMKRPDRHDQWQEQELEKRLKEELPSAHLFSLAGGLFQTVPIDEFFTEPGIPASAKLFKDRIVINTETDLGRTINISDISEVNLQYKDVLEIITKDSRFRLHRLYPKWSAYLWVKCVKILRQYDIINTNYEVI